MLLQKSHKFSTLFTLIIHDSNNKKTMRSKIGIVTSDINDKTIVVTVHSYKMHSKYKKRYRTSKKFHADDPKNTHKIGETVTIYETKPLSKLKRWTVVPPNKTSQKIS